MFNRIVSNHGKTGCTDNVIVFKQNLRLEYTSSVLLKNEFLVTREMAPQLGEPAVLAADPGPSPAPTWQIQFQGI